MNEAMEADRAIVMNHGHIAVDGTPREVFARVEDLRALGLAAPDTVELLYELRSRGIEHPAGCYDRGGMRGRYLPRLFR